MHPTHRHIDRLSSKARALLWCGAASLLLIPAIAMQFTSEVNWSAGDFAAMGALLAALCVGIELSIALTRTQAGKGIAIAAALMVFLLVWAELAVGILP